MALKVVEKHAAVADVSDFTGDIEEPDWAELIPALRRNDAERRRDRAHREWLRITGAMRGVGTLALENGPTIKRLIIAYIRYDIAVAQVMRTGAVTRTAKTKVPQLSMWQVEMRAADADANSLEQELGLTPRRRGAASKAPQKRRGATAADSYLKNRAR